MPNVVIPIGPLGPLLTVFIGVSAPRKQRMEAEGVPTVGIRPAQLLIDTGSSGACVDRGILDDLEIPPSGEIWMHSASTIAPEKRWTYDVSLWVETQPGVLHPLIATVSVVGTVHQHQGFDGLLGRDVLEKCTMSYIGTSKQVQLAFDS